MARSISRASSAAATSLDATEMLDRRAPGAWLRIAPASSGRNSISPRSDSDSRQCMSLLAGSNSSWPVTSVSSASSWASTAGASCSHRRVGFRPDGARTNSSSSKKSRSRARALLVAG